jgi:hypothetical protein
VKCRRSRVAIVVAPSRSAAAITDASTVPSRRVSVRLDQVGHPVEVVAIERVELE